MNSIIDIDRVIEELTAETGLDDFGDPTYRGDLQLDALVAAAHRRGAPERRRARGRRGADHVDVEDPPAGGAVVVRPPGTGGGAHRGTDLIVGFLPRRDDGAESPSSGRSPQPVAARVGGVVTGSSTVAEHLRHRRTLRGRAGRRVRASSPAQPRRHRGQCTTTRPTCRSSASSRWRSTSWRSVSL